MGHDDTAAHLAGGLPDYLPSGENSGHYDLLKPVADYLDKHEEDIENVDFASTVQKVGRQDLTIEAGETETVPEDDRWIYRDVFIDGTLVIEGTLAAKDITVNGDLVMEGGGLVNTDTQYRREVLTELEILGRLISVPPRENEDVEHYRARLIAEFSTLTGKGTIETLISTAAEMLTTTRRRITFQEPHQGEHGTAEVGLPSDALDQHELEDGEVIEMLERLIPAGYRLQGLRTGTFTYISKNDYEVSNFDASKGYDGLGANGDPKDNGGTYAGVIN